VSCRTRRLPRWALAPAVALVAGACFATRNDVRLLQAQLQGDLARLRAEATRADSAHRAEMQRVARDVGTVADSLRGVNAFLVRFSTDVSRFQGDLTLTMHSFGQQLIAVQELAGQSQKKLQELRADLEARSSELSAAAVPRGAPGAPGAAAAGAAAAGAPGPNQLLQLAQEQFEGNRPAAARAAFQDLLAQYPASDLVPEALYGIARTYDFEHNAAAADSAYQVVVDRFPKSDRAPSALFKRAMIQIEAGQVAKARALFQQIVDKYPGSTEAEVAKDRLRAPA